MAGDRATKMLLLSSARTLFSEKGYDETAVEEICALAGVAKGTFFYYFESKQQIVRHILSTQLGEYRDKLSGQMETFKDAVSRLEYLVCAFIDLSDIGTEPDAYFKENKADWYKTAVNEERMKALFPLLEDTIAQGIEQGFFKVNNPDICSAIAFLGIDAYLHCGIRNDDETRDGIREITAKTLGIKESALVI